MKIEIGKTLMSEQNAKNEEDISIEEIISRDLVAYRKIHKTSTVTTIILTIFFLGHLLYTYFGFYLYEGGKWYRALGYLIPVFILIYISYHMSFVISSFFIKTTPLSNFLIKDELKSGPVWLEEHTTQMLTGHDEYDGYVKTENEAWKAVIPSILMIGLILYITFSDPP